MPEQPFYKGTHPHADTWASPPGDVGAAEHEHMADSCLEHCLSPEEGRFFDSSGYLHVKGALGLPLLERLRAAVDRVDAEERAARGLVDGRLNLLDCIGLDESFLSLIDLPTTFPKVQDINYRPQVSPMPHGDSQASASIADS